MSEHSNRKKPLLANIVRLRWFNESVLGSRHAMAANNHDLSVVISYGPRDDDLLGEIPS